MEEPKKEIIYETLKFIFGIDVIQFCKQTSNHISTIILIPAILGGIWQLIELWNISPAFIRFFSVSQIIPDGTLILALLILSLILIFLISHIISFVDGIAKKDTSETIPSVTKYSPLKFYLFFLALFCTTIYLFKFLTADGDIISLTFILVIDISMLCLILICLRISILTSSEKFKPFLKIHIPFISILAALVFISFCSQFRKAIEFPKNLTNMQSVTNKHKFEKPFYKMKILYMNDKYIFVKNYYYIKTPNENYKAFDFSILNYDEFLKNNSEKDNIENHVLERLQ